MVLMLLGNNNSNTCQTYEPWLGLTGGYSGKENVGGLQNMPSLQIMCGSLHNVIASFSEFGQAPLQKELVYRTFTL